ncbi:CHRD domain-containing protein [Deinococcus hopiensis]|uniref:CHRD domain-containing protein n=1 Tax=Deinococcus hopiensis KR-140 TaxID=695939 RepID=A0A1W1UUI1_9DEIO|nr:CHRD domain-containing protein [Deinococcus hopiensis]SMB84471.1 CHRD domain-containing protein [Deinococcus hopiensis KR-140]
MIVQKSVLGLFTATLLGSCSMMMGQGTTYNFKHNPNAADPAAMGRAVATMDGSMVSTTLSLSGLTPGKAYIAHYHAFGPASSTDPCASSGPVTLGFPNFSADANGNASVTVKGDMTKIMGDMGAYINVHYASDPSVVPICAPVKMTKG